MKTENKPIPNEELYTMFENVLSRIEQGDKALGEKLEKLNLSPAINLPTPHMTEFREILTKVLSNTYHTYKDIAALWTHIKEYLNDKKTEARIGTEVGKYKAEMDDKWTTVETSLNRLFARIPENYDIDKRLVKSCV